MDKAFLTVKEAASLLRVSSGTIYRLIREGRFPCLFLGSRRVIPSTAFDAWVSQSVSGGAA